MVKYCGMPIQRKSNRRRKTGNGGQTYTVKIPTDKKPGEIFIASVRPKW
uniref:Uncharacterized protein n=1 Tax=viral metagenome TaxID=1070528 RepID=A0A6C0EMM7_9ZZZZ